MPLPALLAGAGLGLELFGQKQAGDAQSSALREEARIARQNAKAAKLKAQSDAEQQVIQSRQIMSETQTDFAAAGVEGGSVFAVMANSAVNAEMDRLNILFGGDVRANMLKSQAAGFGMQADDAKSAGLFSLLATGFKGAGKVSEMGGATTKVET